MNAINQQINIFCMYITIDMFEEKKIYINVYKTNIKMKMNKKIRQFKSNVPNNNNYHRL